MTQTTTGTEFVTIDPAHIEVEENVRTQVILDRAFVESIRQNGVMEPVICRRTPDGVVQVRMGQRRVLAAREVGAASIPAIIHDGNDSTIDRLVQQYAENEHRAGLTEGERAAVFQQLAFEGLSLTQIAKRTGEKKNTVEAGITVASSEFAGSVIAVHTITLDQTAQMIEFEDDPQAIERLVNVAENSPEQFAHELQRQRDKKESDAQIAQLRDETAAAGSTILDTRPNSYYDKEHISIKDLRTLDGERITVEALAGVPAEEKFAYVGANWSGDVSVTYFVTNPKTHGFKKEGSTAGAMTDEQKAERRELIANNKAWDSAETVRREWLTTFLSRKTLPKDAVQFIATAITAHRYTVDGSLGDGNRMAATWLGVDSPEYGTSALGALVESQPTKAGHVVLAVVLATLESNTSRTTWRNPTAPYRAYFAQLEAWGYALSEVEQIVTATN